MTYRRHHGPIKADLLQQFVADQMLQLPQVTAVTPHTLDRFLASVAQHKVTALAFSTSAKASIPLRHAAQQHSQYVTVGRVQWKDEVTPQDLSPAHLSIASSLSEVTAQQHSLMAETKYEGTLSHLVSSACLISQPHVCACMQKLTSWHRHSCHLHCLTSLCMQDHTFGVHKVPSTVLLRGPVAMPAVYDASNTNAPSVKPILVNQQTFLGKPQSSDWYL